ncbi:MAG: helix-turn-helix domain-containing protein [Candidatus Limnocylindrales bacterium]
MEDIRVGAAVRAVRMRRGLRQSDVATIAGVSQTTVSLVERGHLESLTLASVRAVARAVDVWLQLEPRWRGADLPRLLDERHAELVGLVVAELRRRGWEVRVEYSFNVRGERGSVDVLGWLPALDVLLIVEVKTQIVDVQELLSTFDRKRRVVLASVSAELGWRPNLVGRLLVVPETTRVREAVARHSEIFAAALPSRNIGVRRWLREPAQAIAGIGFLRNSNDGNPARGRGGVSRARRPAGGKSLGGPRSSSGRRTPPWASAGVEGARAHA